MVTPRKTLVQMAAEKCQVNDMATASCARKYIVYKVTLEEIGLMLRSERIAKQLLIDIKKGLNDVSNGFQDLRGDKRFKHKREIEKLVPILIQAVAKADFAIQEWRTTGKSPEHFEALGWCKEHIFQINLQLQE